MIREKDFQRKKSSIFSRLKRNLGKEKAQKSTRERVLPLKVKK